MRGDCKIKASNGGMFVVGGWFYKLTMSGLGGVFVWWVGSSLVPEGQQDIHRKGAPVSGRGLVEQFDGFRGSGYVLKDGLLGESCFRGIVRPLAFLLHIDEFGGKLLDSIGESLVG